MLEKFDLKLAGLNGKQRLFASFILGAAGVLGLSPLFWWPVYILCFAVFLTLLFHAPNKKSLFLNGFAFGMGFFTFGLYWISFALHVDLAKWWWLIPAAALGLPFVLSFYYGLAALCLWVFRDNRVYMTLSAVISFSLAEYARGTLLTGFPWNLPSYIWVDSILGLNLSWGGAYGLNIFVFAMAAFPALALSKKRYALGALFIWLGLSAYGYLYLPAENLMTPLTDKTIMIVQPNIPQIDKWNPNKRIGNFTKLVELSTPEKGANPDFILWPETALTIRKEDLPYIKSALDPILDNDRLLLTGITDARQSDNGGLVFFNSLIGLNGDASVILQYDKHHLVPFGEYVPLRKFFNFGAIATIGDFQTGPGPRTINLNDDFSISPLICYEVIFPGAVTDKSSRPDLLVNITNDGWYLKSSGPHQHLAMSRARAIETGLPLARAANTGISALVDPYGRLLLYLPLQTDGTILAGIPKALPPTLYSRYENKIFMSIVFIFFLLISVRRINAKCNRRD